MKQSTLNRVWARLILTSLYRAGVQDICIAPGSRSTPLILEAIALSQLEGSVRLHTHFDERGLGFLALGLAKASSNRVAVIVTSGTAVSNLMPAVTESRLTREKLILLTADRPIELIQCGANQAIVQRHFFGEQADYYCDLPSPSEMISPAWLVSLLDERLFQQAQGGGSIHLNCPFPEPLYGQMDDDTHYLLPVKTWLTGQSGFLTFTQNTPELSSICTKWRELQHKKGVIIAGNVDFSDRHAIGKLAQMLGWPLFCDPQAGKGSNYAGFDVWLQNAACLSLLEEADCIIQFGARLVSKRLRGFIERFEGQFWLVDPYHGRLDEFYLQATRIVAKSDLVANALTNVLIACGEKPEYAGWAAQLLHASAGYFTLLKRFVQIQDKLSEIAIASDFKHWIAPKSTLFIGNSLVIRLLDMCCQLPDVAVFANRGASGIDGLIATACGVQRARQGPMVCFLGDTSALYDLNSLALLAKNPYPFVLLIVNNDGGGIFDLLPVPKEHKDVFYRQSHGLDFYHAAAMFGLAYRSPETLFDAQVACLEAQQQDGATLIELRVPPGESGLDLEQLFNDVVHASL